MGQPKKNLLRRLNVYSWSMIIAFICAFFAMQYHTPDISLVGFFQTLPLIVIAVYWCEKSIHGIKPPECILKNIEIFHRDLFILSFSFFLGCLLSLVFAYNNSDAKGWWPFIIYFITLYGLFFAVIFSGTVLLIKNHKIYTIIFSFLILTLVSCGNFFLHHIPLPLLGRVDTFFVITGSLLIVHCLLTIGWKMIGLFFHGNKSSN